MLRNLRAMSLTLGVLLGLAAACGAGTGESIEPPRDCGSRALYGLLALEGRPASLTAIRAQLPPLPERGHSLKELRDAAGALGVRLAGVRLMPSPQAPARPALAFLSRGGHGHFIVVRPVGHSGRLVQVIDPGGEVEVLDMDRLTSRPEWTGLALVPARGIPWPLLACGMVALAGLVLTVFRFRRPRGSVA